MANIVLKHVRGMSAPRGLCQQEIDTFTVYHAPSVRTRYSHGLSLESQISRLANAFAVNVMPPWLGSEKLAA